MRINRYPLPLITAQITALICSAAVIADTQDEIDAAFGLQQEGATLTEVRQALAEHPDKDATGFALSAVDFLLAGEGLLQAAHRHGFLGPFRTVAPMVGERASFLQWIANEAPEATTARDIHDAISDFVGDLNNAERRLSVIDGDFKCAINIHEIRFDINADGVTTEGESLGALFALLPERMTRWNPEEQRMETSPIVPAALTVAFDRGDASWLRGYCHVLMAAGEWALAHDGQELFDRTGHVFFPKAEIPYGFLPNSTYTLERLTGGAMRTPTPFDITDVLVFFGNMRLPVDEPDRMQSVLQHLRAAVKLGHAMWEHYDLEEDNDREWIPNPRQTASFSDLTVDQEMHDAWLLFLDEMDDLLAGRKVLRFWRGDGSKGIDVPKLFQEPQEFDLLYWIQGSAAAPYLREGEFTSPGTWAQLEREFNRQVFRNMFWFN